MEAQAGRNSGAFGRDTLKGFAADLGLRSDAFNTCLDTGRYAARVRAETAMGRAKGVSSTPTIFVNEERFTGIPPFEDLVRAISLASLPTRR
jgi:protein-disulfide isomerase